MEGRDANHSERVAHRRNRWIRLDFYGEARDADAGARRGG